jgi:hypothetical protein
VAHCAGIPSKSERLHALRQLAGLLNRDILHGVNLLPLLVPNWLTWEEARLRRNSPKHSSRNTPNLYQYNFNATWISRDVRWNNGGWPADVICPTLKLPICAFGLLNCGVFKKLNASARNCTRLF